MNQGSKLDELIVFGMGVMGIDVFEWFVFGMAVKGNMVSWKETSLDRNTSLV